MYQKPTVPRSIGGVLDDTLQLYKAALPSCWLPALLGSMVSAGLSYYMLASMPLTAGPAQLGEMFARYKAMGLGFGILNLAVMLVSLAFYGMLIVNIAAVARGETPAFGASIAQAVRRLPALVGASILFVIALVVGFCLLIIPGFYVWNRLQLYMVPLVTESQGPMESLGTSWRLVGGNWWRTATVVMVMFIILLVLEFVLGSLAGVVGLVIGGRPTDPTQFAAKLALASLTISAVVRIFSLPLIFAAFVALYQDLLLRKGGGDLVARLGALPKG